MKLWNLNVSKEKQNAPELWLVLWNDFHAYISLAQKIVQRILRRNS